MAKWLELKNGKCEGFAIPAYQYEAKEFVNEIEENCDCIIVNEKGNEQAELIEIYEYKDGTRFKLSYTKKDDDVPHIECKDRYSDRYDYVY